MSAGSEDTALSHYKGCQQLWALSHHSVTSAHLCWVNLRFIHGVGSLVRPSDT